MALGRHGRDARRSAFDDGGDDGPAVDLTPGVVDEITWYMREHKVTRAQLAGAMGVSPGRVAQLLSGREALTPRTLGTVLAALGARLEVTLHPAADHPAADHVAA